MQTPGGKEQGVQEENHCQTQINLPQLLLRPEATYAHGPTLVQTGRLPTGSLEHRETGWAKMKESEKI